MTRGEHFAPFSLALSNNTANIRAQIIYYTCNLTLRCVRVTIIAVEKQWSWTILCVCILCLSYPLCKSHPVCAVLHFHLLPVWLHHASSHYVTYGVIFGKNVILFKICVLIFCSYNICLKHFSFSVNSAAVFRKLA